MRRLRTILRSRYLFKILVIIVLIIDICFLNNYVYKSKYYKDETQFEGIITNIIFDDDKTTISIKSKEILLVKYYDKEGINDLKLGDTIYIEGKLEEASNNTIPNLFNYKEYLYNRGIYYIVEAKKIVKVKNNVSIFFFIKNKIKDRINKISNNSDYLKSFILGDKSEISEDIKNSYIVNGILHLFSISGMHISFFATFIMYFIRRISYNKKYNYSIIVIFLLFYLFLVNYTYSVIRAFMLYILRIINNIFNLKIKIVDLALISLIILILIYPRIILDMGFQYSYLISFSLIMFSNNINKRKNYITKSLYISLISFLVSIPICIYNFYKINLLAIFLNILVIPLVSVIIFPLSLMTFIIPRLDIVLSFFINILENIANVCSNIKIFTIVLARPNILIIIIYYLFIYLGLYKNKYLIFLILILMIHKNINYLDPNLDILYLDIGQGDSILLRFPYNKGNILIDTGGNYLSNYSIAINKIIPYLESVGVSKIDYLICSHGDYDHIGEGINLINNFKVERVIFNNSSYNELEEELIKVLKKNKIKYYKNIRDIKISNYKLYFLGTKIYDNENDNSNVIYFKYDNYKFLFMGDAGRDRERDIQDRYGLDDIDFLKVSHHGSDTASSKEFIDKINPKYSIISVGKNNRYGHPSKKVLENLKDSYIYRTDINGSIMVRIRDNRLNIKDYSP